MADDESNVVEGSANNGNSSEETEEGPFAAYTRVHFISGESWGGLEDEPSEEQDEIAKFDGFDIPIPNEGDTVHLGDAIEDQDGDVNVNPLSEGGEHGYVVKSVDYVYLNYSEEVSKDETVDWSTPMVSIVVSVEQLRSPSGD